MAQVHFLLRNANRVTQPFLVFPGQEFNLKVVARHFHLDHVALCLHTRDGLPLPTYAGAYKLDDLASLLGCNGTAEDPFVISGHPYVGESAILPHAPSC